MKRLSSAIVPVRRELRRDEQLSKLVQDGTLTFLYYLVRCLRDQCNAYEANWRMKLGPLVRLVEKESQRISSSYNKKSGQAAASNIFGGR